MTFIAYTWTADRHRCIECPHDCLYWRAATGPIAGRGRRVGLSLAGVVRGKIRWFHGPNFHPVAGGGQFAVILDGAPASRRRRQPVKRRHGFKIHTADQRATRTDWRPIIHLGGPVPTPPSADYRRALAPHGCMLIGPWLLWRPHGRTRPQGSVLYGTSPGTVGRAWE